MKPVDVARLLNIGGSTVRAWSKEFAAYLSPSAVGGDERRRDFSPQDVQIMALVKQMSDHNTHRDEMNLELRRLQTDDWRALPSLEQAPGAGAALMPVGTAQALSRVEQQALLREISTLQNDVRSLKGELADERGDKEALLRELAEMNGKLQRALLQVELYEQGRLKPPTG